MINVHLREMIMHHYFKNIFVNLF